MIQITPQMRIFLAVEPVDFRKGIDGLAALCRQKLQCEPGAIPGRLLSRRQLDLCGTQPGAWHQSTDARHHLCDQGAVGLSGVTALPRTVACDLSCGLPDRATALRAEFGRRRVGRVAPQTPGASASRSLCAGRIAFARPALGLKSSGR